MSKSSRILAVDPGTRQIGLAVLDGQKLIYHGVHTVADRSTGETILRDVRELFQRLLRDFSPDRVVVERTFLSKSSNIALLTVVADEVARLARRQGLPVGAIAPCTVRKALCGFGHASKEALAKVIVAKYPHLRVYLVERPKWKAAYNFNRFDAIGLGLCAVCTAA